MRLPELEQITREVIDGQGDSSRWSPAEIRRWCAIAFNDEWAHILDVAPFYRAHNVEVTLDANSMFPESALTTGADDATRRFYRIIAVSDSIGAFRQVRPSEAPLVARGQYNGPRCFFEFGPEWQVLPPMAGTPITVTCNWRPRAPTQLLDPDNTDFDFPDGDEHVIAYSAGAALLNKGAVEAGASGVLRALAAEAREGMLNNIRRRTIWPTIMATPDTRHDWAG